RARLAYPFATVSHSLVSDTQAEGRGGRGRDAVSVSPIRVQPRLILLEVGVKGGRLHAGEGSRGRLPRCWSLRVHVTVQIRRGKRRGKVLKRPRRFARLVVEV